MAAEEMAVYEAFLKEGMRRAFSDDDPADLHRWLTEQLARLGGKSDDDAIMTWEQSFDYYDKVMEQRAAERLKPEEERKIIDWPWASWNDHIDNFDPGMLGVLTAPDGMGKTILAESLGEHWARRRNRVVFVHFELNRMLMMDRRASRHTDIPRHDLAHADLSPAQWAELKAMRNRLLGWEGNITYLHTPGWNMEKLVALLKRLRVEGMCDVVIVDYLEKAAASRRQFQFFGSSLNQRQADDVNQLKDFAESAEIPVMILMQMNKAGKQAKTTEIDRMDIRDSSEKTDRANLVVLFSRASTVTGYSDIMDCNIDKNTMGKTGRFKMRMQPQFFRVADIEAREPAPWVGR